MSEWLRLSSVTTSSEESVHPTKLWVRMEGPSTIERVHVNSNLTTLLHKGITERINIPRDLSYCWPFHIPLWRQFLAWIVFEVFTFYLWSFFSTSHSSELWVEFFWIQFLFVHLWQSESCHGGEECCAHRRVMLVVTLLNSSISILVWRSSCVSDLARTDSTFHRYGNSDTDFCD